MFYRKTKGTKQLKRKISNMEKHEEFWAGLWLDNTKTPSRKWMNTVAKKRAQKLRMCRNSQSPKRSCTKHSRNERIGLGIDGVQNLWWKKFRNLWWKKFRGTWSAILRCFNQSLELPDEIPDWLTHGRTVLLPKTEDLSNERNYRPITCLNTCYKVFTGMIGNYMKEHAERNNIWGRSQLETCSGVLVTVDQLIIDNAIMDEVRNQQRNLAVAFYDYQKAYDMVRHDWMIRVYQWMGVPEKVVNVIVKLMEGWKTRLEVTEDGKVLASRKINIRKGFLQGDSYSPVGFCLTELPISMLIEETDGYTMGQRDKERVKRTHSLFIDDLKTYQESH